MGHYIQSTSAKQAAPRTIWIVGASSGIGLALTEMYLKQGCRVIISARRQDTLENVRQAMVMKVADADIHALATDISNADSVAAAQQSVQSLYGSIDAVIINAGICEYINSVAIDMDSVRRVMETNFFGALNVVNAGLPLLRAALEQGHRRRMDRRMDKRPQLVFVSSSVTYQALPRAGAYGGSKAALSYFAESLKLDLKHEGIDVRIVSPGFVKTPLTDQNDFPMPARITSMEAAERIVAGLSGSKFDVNFPKRFTWSLKLLSVLPTKMKHWLLGKTSRHEDDLKRMTEQSVSKVN